MRSQREDETREIRRDENQRDRQRDVIDVGSKDLAYAADAWQISVS